MLKALVVIDYCQLLTITFCVPTTHPPFHKNKNILTKTNIEVY